MLSTKRFVAKSSRFMKFQFKMLFLRTQKPLLTNMTVDELPDEGTHSVQELQSRKTYTKWFNPHHFDPRSPDYIDTVRSNWEDDVTEEDIGNGNIHNISNPLLSLHPSVRPYIPGPVDGSALA